jgi:hypothetical protein
MSRITRPRLVGLACASVLAVLALFVGNGVGDPSSNSSKTTSDSGWTVTHTSAAHIASGGVKFVYVYVKARVQGGQFLGGPINCPRRYPHPIGGLFDSTSVRVFLSTDRPSPFIASAGSAKGWNIGVTNVGSSAARVLAGAVCAQ